MANELKTERKREQGTKYGRLPLMNQRALCAYTRTHGYVFFLDEVRNLHHNSTLIPLHLGPLSTLKNNDLNLKMGYEVAPSDISAREVGYRTSFCDGGHGPVLQASIQLCTKLNTIALFLAPITPATRCKYIAYTCIVNNVMFIP